MPGSKSEKKKKKREDCDSSLLVVVVVVHQGDWWRMSGLLLSFEYITLREASEQTGGEEGEVGEGKKACM